LVCGNLVYNGIIVLPFAPIPDKVNTEDGQSLQQAEKLLKSSTKYDDEDDSNY